MHTIGDSAAPTPTPTEAYGSPVMPVHHGMSIYNMISVSRHMVHLRESS